MNTDFYTNIGLAVVWCMESIFIPVGVAVSARIIIAEKLLRSQPKRQRKKRSKKPLKL
ncbi:MAG TPA: hypothetical protein GXX36_05880 [Clostridiaceae bacterium]|nr:hypothetical protein [Clostridiaceae bacterium]HHV99088.1 hypothetical protein [Clostridiaceae bacterium]